MQGRMRRTGGASCGTSCEALEGRALLSAGDLDLTFGGDGRVAAGSGQQGGSGDVVIAPDGKLITFRNQYDRDSGWFTVTRLNSDGSPDTTFGAPGGSGSVTPPNVVPPETEFHGQGVTALAVQRNRKVLLAGQGGDENRSASFIMRLREDGSLDPTFGGGDGDGVVTLPAGPFQGLAVDVNGKVLSARAGAVYRFNSDGTPDTTYGGGDGVATLPGAGGAFAVTDLALAPDGLTVIAVGGVSTDRFGIAKLDASGTPVPGFGGSTVGVATAPVGPGGLLDGVPAAVAVSPGGQVVLAGRRGGDQGRFTIVRYTANGSVDTTFSGDGVASVGAPSTDLYGRGAYAVTVQPDGKVVAAGDAGYAFNVVRFNADGSPDTTFGTGGSDGDGTVTTEFEPIDAPFWSPGTASGVAVQPDGKVVAVASVSGAEDGFSSYGNLLLARYLGGPGASGTDLVADPDFGASGAAVTPMGPNASAEAVISIADGHFIVVGGSSGRFAAIAYDINGQIDAKPLGAAGTTVNFGSGPESAYAVAMDVERRVVLAGTANGKIALARLWPGGTPDSRFDHDGRVVARLAAVAGVPDVKSVRAAAYSAAVLPDGHILVAGTQDIVYDGEFPGQTLGALVVARFNSDGSRDRTFGKGGRDGDGVVSDTARQNSGRALALLPDGDFLVSGARRVAVDRGVFVTDFAVTRFNADGSVDTTFGAGGTATAHFTAGPSGDASADSVVVTADGKIVLAGPTSVGAGLALARFNRDGSVDTTFGAGGRVVPDLRIGVPTSDWVAALDGSDGGVVVAGTTVLARPVGTTSDVVLVRIRADGTIDPALGGNSGHVATGFGGARDRVGGILRAPDGRFVIVGASDGRFGVARFREDPGNPAGTLKIDGTDGNDLIRVDRDGDRLTIAVNGAARTLPLAGVTRLVLSGLAGNDRLDVSARVEIPATLDGGAGDDILKGGSGDDLLLGGDGNDMMDGRRGADLFRGGAGRDGVDYTGRGAAVAVDIGAGDANDGESGERDEVKPDVEDVFGGRGNDRLIGSASDNLLQGGVGDDVLIGGGGSDTLRGGVGNDTLFGRDAVPDFSNRDILSGGDGIDEAEGEVSDVILGIENPRL